MTQDSLSKSFKEYDLLLGLSNYLTSVCAPSGCPALCITAGYQASGEPLGVTMIAKTNEDVKLLELAYAFEQKISRHNPREV